MSKDHKNNWPTLKGRLSQPLTSEKEALEQLEKSVTLSKLGKKRLKKLSTRIVSNEN